MVLFNTHLILDPFSSFAPPPSKNLLKKALPELLKKSQHSICNVLYANDWQFAYELANFLGRNPVLKFLTLLRSQEVFAPSHFLLEAPRIPDLGKLWPVGHMRPFKCHCLACVRPIINNINQTSIFFSFLFGNMRIYRSLETYALQHRRQILIG